MKKKCLWIRTGGTIEATNDEVGVLRSGYLDYEVFRYFIPWDLISLTNVCLSAAIDSTNATPMNFREIAYTIYSNLEDYDAFVVTCGTDTMTYICASSTVMLENFPKPVIFTGAQRPFTEEDSDGKINLYNAFKAASQLEYGIWLCFGKRLIDGHCAVKVDSREDDAFVDAVRQRGYFKEDGAVVLDYPQKKPSGLPTFRNIRQQDVFLLKLFPGIKSGIFEYIVDKGYGCIILECYGLGGIPQNLLDSIEHVIRKGISVVATTQCIYGGSDLSIYGVGQDALDVGVVDGGCETVSLLFCKQLILS